MAPSKHNILSYAALAVSAAAYAALAYATPRSNFTQLLLLYAVVFVAYLYVTNQRFNLWHGIVAAIFFRLIFLFATPALSDDYFRFVWDGRLLAAGQNPYLYLPQYFMQPEAPLVPGLTQELFAQLNSQGYYSVYPPVSQAVFWLAALPSPQSVTGSVVVMRLILLLAEAGSVLLLWRLLRKMALPEKHVLLYALNPLVILELVGNLHFEALMIFFLLLALYQLFYHRLVWSGFAFGLAIGTKLLPLMFLPFVLRRLGWRQFILYGTVVLITVVAQFAPLINQDVLQHIFQSLDLYFQRFEFNASVYYLLRWLGFRLAGYNLISILGPLLSLVTLVTILSMASVKKLGSVRRLAGYMAAALTVYLLLSTTVHPWYLSTLLALTVMSHFRFAITWSGLAMLSYAAYRTPTYHEDLLLVTLEYTMVLLWLMVELYLYRQRRHHANLNE
ncbi:glycosyltransferase family 87 protein [Pontibacter anaerobius]|uniref:Glycosyltransferase family 87 protein n=1 Tax=Pontibacter anaerobius TaxID=2993940 RepID=A0ABT3RHR2_9BACT|nr:glycosyltransferase family 87 protein [Pontibacter anaerobius]MCX2741090.1 glycosyltransferase family 87 protein [Pontibacter anaerobius]